MLKVHSARSMCYHQLSYLMIIKNSCRLRIVFKITNFSLIRQYGINIHDDALGQTKVMVVNCSFLFKLKKKFNCFINEFYMVTLKKKFVLLDVPAI